MVNNVECALLEEATRSALCTLHGDVVVAGESIEAMLAQVRGSPADREATQLHSNCIDDHSHFCTTVEDDDSSSARTEAGGTLRDLKIRIGLVLFEWDEYLYRTQVDMDEFVVLKHLQRHTEDDDEWEMCCRSRVPTDWCGSRRCV